MPAKTTRNATVKGRRWVSVNQVAEHLGVTTRCIFQMMADGRLTAYRNGTRFIRMDLDEVDAAMKPVRGGVK